MAKVKKQLYITSRQEKLLKKEATQLEMLFSELVRTIFNDYIRRNSLDDKKF